MISLAVLRAGIAARLHCDPREVRVFYDDHTVIFREGDPENCYTAVWRGCCGVISEGLVKEKGWGVTELADRLVGHLRPAVALQ